MSTVFSSSKEMFKMSDLKKQGFGSVDHKPEIAAADMDILGSLSVDTPCGLQRKVWFDLMYFLCRCGRENLRSMKKDTFAVSHDATGREYVHQVIDESDKNHRAESSPDDTIGEGKMYARQDDPTCPVAAFKKYIGKLSPNLDDLWQRPLDTFNDSDPVWYCKAPLGKNTLGNMMPEISRVCLLSKRYTNHCIRTTAISALDRAGIEARHIMRTSGHKSEASIRSYSCRLSEEKQHEMSNCLNNALGATKNKCETKSSTGTEHDVLSNEEILNIFNDENMFLEVQPTPSMIEPALVPVAKVSRPVLCPTTVQTNSSEVTNIAPQIINVPGTSMQLASSHPQYYINPNMSNCTVNFHFNGN